MMATATGQYNDGYCYPLPAIAGANATLVWDAENRLIEVKNGTTTIATYQYDYLGRRIKKHLANGTDTLYIYDSWNMIADYTIQNSTFKIHHLYTWGMDLSGSMQGAGGVGGLLAIHEASSNGSVKAGQTLYPTFDGNGNITRIIDSSSAVVCSYAYDPFGNFENPAGNDTDNSGYAAEQPFGFSTKYRDTETGLYYYGYRYYDPVTGRWPSRDPIEEAGGLNLYGFVGNDGVNAVDDLGMIPVEVKKYIDGDKNHVTIEIDESISSFPSRNGEGRGVTFVPKPWALVTFDLDASISSGKCCLKVAFMDIGPYYILIAGLAANKEGVLGHEQRHIIAYEKKVKEIEGTAKLIKACYEGFWEAFIKALQIQKRLTRSLQHARSSEQNHKDGGFNNPGTPKAGDDNYKPIPGFPATYK